MHSHTKRWTECLLNEISALVYKYYKSTMKWTAQQRVPLKNYTKWNKLLEVVIWWETNFYNKIKEFGEGWMLGIHWP